MKYLLICMSFYTIYAVAQPRQMKNDLQRDNLRGRVKSYTEVSYKIADTADPTFQIAKSNSNQQRSKWIFDKYGWVIEQENFTDKDNMIDRSDYKYKNGKRQCDVMLRFKKGQPPFYDTILRRQIFYTQKGLIDSTKDYTMDGVSLMSKSVYVYKTNNEIDMYNYNYDGQDIIIPELSVFIWNIYRKTCKTKVYDRNGILYSITKSKYDDKRNIIGNTRTDIYSDEEAKLYTSVKRYLYYSYDIAGNWLKKKETRTDNERTLVFLYKRQYTYY